MFSFRKKEETPGRSWSERLKQGLTRTREMRGGKLYDSRFGVRMGGQGEYHAVSITTSCHFP